MADFDDLDRRERYQYLRDLGFSANQSRSFRDYTEPSRLDLFSDWSSRYVGFPDGVLRWIESQNDAAGFDPYDSYGFRVFYARFVWGDDELEVDEIRGIYH